MRETRLFSTSAKKISIVRDISVGAESDHSIGGSFSESGYSLVGQNCTPHFLFRLDQRESLVPNVLDHTRWLPMAYSFLCTGDYDDGITAYRVVDDNTLEFFSPTKSLTAETAFYDNYPTVFPRGGIGLFDADHDTTDVRDSIRLAAIFGLEHFTDRQREEALEMIRPIYDTCDAQELYDLGIDGFLDCWGAPFPQGPPNGIPCLNPNCRIFGEHEMSTFATVVGHPTDDYRFWSDSGDPEVMLIFQTCDTCKTIHVSQQCT